MPAQAEQRTRCSAARAGIASAPLSDPLLPFVTNGESARARMQPFLATANSGELHAFFSLFHRLPFEEANDSNADIDTPGALLPEAEATATATAATATGGGGSPRGQESSTCTSTSNVHAVGVGGDQAREDQCFEKCVTLPHVEQDRQALIDAVCDGSRAEHQPPLSKVRTPKPNMHAYTNTSNARLTCRCVARSGISSPHGTWTTASPPGATRACGRRTTSRR